MKRLSPWTLADRAIQAGKTAWAVYGALVAIYFATPYSWHKFIWIFGLYYTWTRIYLIFYEWCKIRYSINSSTLTVRKRGLSKEAKQIHFNTVKYYRIEDNPFLRFVKCAAITLFVEGSDSAGIRLDAVKFADRIAIQNALEEHHVQASSPSGLSVCNNCESYDNKSIVVRSPVVHELTLIDYMAIGFTNGLTILAVPIIVSIGHRIIPGTGIGFWEKVILVFQRGNIFLITLFIVAIFAFCLAYGTILSWLRYRGMRLTRSATGYVWVAGVLNKKYNYIPFGQVTHVVLRQNPLMRIIGRGQVRIVSGTWDGVQSGGVVLASAPMSQVWELCESLMGVPIKREFPVSYFGKKIALASAIVGISSLFLSVGYAIIFGVENWINWIYYIIFLCALLWFVEHYFTAAMVYTIRGRHNFVARKGLFSRNCHFFKSESLTFVKILRYSAFRPARSVFINFHFQGHRFAAVRHLRSDAELVAKLPIPILETPKRQNCFLLPGR